MKLTTLLSLSTIGLTQSLQATTPTNFDNKSVTLNTEFTSSQSQWFSQVTVDDAGNVWVAKYELTGNVSIMVKSANSDNFLQIAYFREVISTNVGISKMQVVFDTNSDNVLLLMSTSNLMWPNEVASASIYYAVFKKDQVSNWNVSSTAKEAIKLTTPTTGENANPSSFVNFSVSNNVKLPGKSAAPQITFVASKFNDTTNVITTFNMSEINANSWTDPQSLFTEFFKPKQTITGIISPITTAIVFNNAVDSSKLSIILASTNDDAIAVSAVSYLSDLSTIYSASPVFKDVKNGATGLDLNRALITSMSMIGNDRIIATGAASQQTPGQDYQLGFNVDINKDLSADKSNYDAAVFRKDGNAPVNGRSANSQFAYDSYANILLDVTAEEYSATSWSDWQVTHVGIYDQNWTNKSSSTIIPNDFQTSNNINYSAFANQPEWAQTLLEKTFHIAICQNKDWISKNNETYWIVNGNSIYSLSGFKYVAPAETSNLGVIIGAVVGGVVAVAAIATISRIIVKKRKKA